jgi:pyruvate formate lyase activating enzyme
VRVSPANHDITGIVTEIQRFSIHDGPGIRTTVFLKGCNLRCFWCHNPETWRPQPELQVFPGKCIGCGACLEACPHDAHVLVDGEKVFHRERCGACGACAETCYAEGLVLVGREMRVDDVMAEVLADRAFYANSGGGVTLSGGEPALQLEFACALLARSRAEGLHTAVETDANYPWARLARLLEVTDYVMTDIKHMDPEVHRAATGVSNARILENHRRLMATDRPVLLRTPVVPTVNASPEAIGAIAAYVRELADLRRSSASVGPPPALELLPFHRLAADKYRSLGLTYKARDLPTPTEAEMAALTEVARSHGIDVRHR